MNVILVQKSIVDLPVDAIVNAADTSLKMNGGVALAIKKKGGKNIEEEALEAAPIELGTAIATSGGKLNVKIVIHAASVKPGQSATDESVKSAARSALELADSLECVSMAFPAIGCGAGSLPFSQGARALLETIQSFSGSNLRTVVLALTTNSFSAFESAAKEMNVSLSSFSQFEKELDEQTARHEAELDAKAQNEPDEPTPTESFDENQNADRNDS